MSHRSDVRPIIGVSAYRERARWGVWDISADLLPAAYARSIATAGGVPVLLPPVEDVAAAVSAVVERLDGLVIAGGADVHPDRYAQNPHRRTSGWRPCRDEWEIALLDAADRRDLPVLGVCRGMQIMAVRAGGTLDQHIPDFVGHDGHSPGADVYGTVVIETVDGSRVRSLVGDHVIVSCHHHQSVHEHPRFVAAAHAADGTLEAIEDPARTFWLAVQWHPEARADAGLFRGLIEAAAGVGPVP